MSNPWICYFHRKLAKGI